MRGLWRSLAYVAENRSGFRAPLVNAAGQISNQQLYPCAQLGADATLGCLKLVAQPDPSALSNLDGLLRPSGLILPAYELAELNRVLIEGNALIPPFQDLDNYWSGLGAVATSNRDHYEFMEAIGALLIDKTTRAQFVAGQSLTKWFPSLTSTQESGLRTMLLSGTPADQAADAFVNRSWPGAACAGTVAMWIGSEWFHLNT